MSGDRGGQGCGLEYASADIGATKLVQIGYFLPTGHRGAESTMQQQSASGTNAENG